MGAVRTRTNSALSSVDLFKNGRNPNLKMEFRMAPEEITKFEMSLTIKDNVTLEANVTCMKFMKY
jgi:hypothetical protein